MDRRAARRIVSVGTLLALTVWMGGLPAAAADEPVPDTPVAASPAVPTVGDEPVTDVTPNPEPFPSPSVEPTAATDEPTTPSTEPTPTPEPLKPGTGNDEPQQPDPGAEPSPTDDPPVTNEEEEPQPRPTPTVGPHSTTITRGHDADTAQAVSTVVIGDFDCSALTTAVTLDNSSGDTAAFFTIQVTKWVDGSYLDVSTEDTSVEAGAVATVHVELVSDAQVRVTVFGATSPVSKVGSCGSFAFDPRATIDTMDCDALAADVTLDNSRSSQSVTFRLVRGSRSLSGLVYDFPLTEVLPAGESKSVQLPLTANAANSVWVGVQGPSGEQLTLANTVNHVCGASPVVSIGELDCGSLSTNVTLDNSRMPAATVFFVSTGDGRYQFERQKVVVAAGATQDIAVTLVDNADNKVWVTTVSPTGETIWAEREGTCGRVVEDPQAAIGEFDCEALAVPVTLDNSRSTVTTAITVHLHNARFDDGTTWILRAGEHKVVSQEIFDHGINTLTVYAGTDRSGAVLARERGPACGLVSVSAVDCASMSVDVAVSGLDPSAYEDAVSYLVSSTKYPEVSTAFAVEISVPSGEVKKVEVPVNRLAGGGLRVQEIGASQASYEGPVVAQCPAEGGSSTTAEPAVLAATGAEGLAQLVLGGLLMLTVGGALLGIGRDQRA